MLAALGPEDAPLSVRVTGAALQPDGTTLLAVDPPLDAVAAARFDRGALEVTRGTTVSRSPVRACPSGSAYRLGRTGLDADGARAAPPSSGAAVLLPAPDYGPVLADDSLLRTLADLDGNDSAFQLVTVSPLVETRLTDRFPGRGRNRYLHRVRGVDSAGNRTPMSRTGPPVHLVDPRSPAAPTVLAAAGGRESATLRWRRDPTRKSSVTGCTARSVTTSARASGRAPPDRSRRIRRSGRSRWCPPRSGCRSAR